jgi:transcriptional regulator with XRE-family HTH domain
MDHSYLARIEKGKIPSLEMLKQICDTYGVPIHSLFGEKVETPSILKEVGVEWITFAKGMEEKKLTPEEIEKMVEVVRALKNL